MANEENAFDKLHPSIKARQQFCVRAEKQPYVRNASGKGFSAKGWEANPKNWLTFEEATTAYKNGVKVFHSNKKDWVLDGIGILLLGDGNAAPQLLGGDLDCCRDPDTGEASPWADAFMKTVMPFYTEVSPSLCGFRFFVNGKLPNEALYVVGFGPQIEIDPETVKKILKLKPTAQKKILAGEDAFNGLEFHESSGLEKGKIPAKHLTITGNRVDEYCFAEITDCSANIATAMKTVKSQKDETDDGKDGECGEDPTVEKIIPDKKKNELPFVGILTVIDTKGFENTGGQLRGPHPLTGSSTGHNLVVNPDKNEYSWMHNNAKTGGDSWVWMAHIACNIPWGMPGAGLMSNPVIRAKTIDYAVAKGYIPPQDPEPEPGIRKVTLADSMMAVGQHIDGTICMVTRDKQTNAKKLVRISDCATYVYSQTTEDGKREYNFRGTGARDGKQGNFVMLAGDMAEPKKLEFELHNAFGIKNDVGKLDYKLIQKITRNTIEKKRITVPCWVDNVPMIPGVDLAEDIEFRLNPLTPALVYDGDLEAAKDQLRKVFRIRKYSSIVAIAVLGSPVYAKYWQNDRFAIAIWGKTGSQKTTIAKHICSLYGTDFNDEHAVIKHSKSGATAVGREVAMIKAGILPRILDDVKTSSNPKDADSYVDTIHSALEGGNKLRGTKDGGLRERSMFKSTLIVTGEVRPEEASTTSRGLNLTWAKVEDSEKLTDLESGLKHMPVIGYNWLRYLALAASDEDVTTGFEAARTRFNDEFAKTVNTNTGRLATNFCLLMAVYNLGMRDECPLNEVFREFEQEFKDTLKEAVLEQGQMQASETEVSKFMRALAELIETKPDQFARHGTPAPSTQRTIGVLPSPGFNGKVAGKMIIYPITALAEMNALKVFTQIPTVASMTNALLEEGLIQKPSKGRNVTIAKIMGNEKPVRGWVFVDDWEDIMDGSVTTRNGDDSHPPATKKRDPETSVAEIAKYPVEYTQVKKAESKFPNEKKSGVESCQEGGVVDTVDTMATSSIVESTNTDISLIPSNHSSNQVSNKEECLKTPAPCNIDVRKGGSIRLTLLADYTTQVPRTGFKDAWDNKIYTKGETASFPAWQAIDLIKRGIAKEAV